MEPQIRDRMSDAVLHEAMRRYDVPPDQIRELDAFESFIYECTRGSDSFILRLSHSLRRSEALILGEVDWINFLSDGGVSVARALPSRGGRLVEAIDDGQGGQFLATAFVKAYGRPLWEVWSLAMCERYGHLLGSIHARSTRYEVSDPAWKRPAWDDEEMQFAERFLPASESIARGRYRALLAHLRSLPRDRASYGMIHQDPHGGNLLVDDAGRITLFDFDDCAYSWFVNDIAIVLFYTVMDMDDWAAFTREFLTHFLRGYRRAHPLDSAWIREIPYFLKLRELDLYGAIHRDFDDVTLIDHWWIERFMHDRKRRIEQDVPFIDVDFAALAAQL